MLLGHQNALLEVRVTAWTVGDYVALSAEGRDMLQRFGKHMQATGRKEWAWASAIAPILGLDSRRRVIAAEFPWGLMVLHEDFLQPAQDRVAERALELLEASTC